MTVLAPVRMLVVNETYIPHDKKSDKEKKKAKLSASNAMFLKSLGLVVRDTQ